MRIRPLLLALLLSACGDDDDAIVVIDAAPVDVAVAVDAAGSIDAAPEDHFTSTWTAADGLPGDDACTPWQLLDTADPEAPVLADGRVTLTTDDDGEFLFYAQTAVVSPDVLVLEARVRVAASVSTATHRAGVGLGFRLGEPKLKNLLQLEDGKVFLLADESTRGPEAAVATSDAPHLYRVVVDLATREIVVSRDGAPILTGAAYVDASEAQRGIFFGDSSGVAHGTSEWLEVNHNAAEDVACR